MTDYMDDGRTILRFSRRASDRFEHLPLSNFYPSPIPAPRGQVAATVEHYFQAAKTTDHDAQDEILAATSPGKAKRLGQKVDLRPDWDFHRLSVMRRAITKKFADHETGLGLWLARTDPSVIVEGNDWGDTFWGAVESGKRVWSGENWLGTLLMARRSELVSELLAVPAKGFDALLFDALTHDVVAASPDITPDIADRTCERKFCSGPQACGLDEEFAGCVDVDDFYDPGDLDDCLLLQEIPVGLRATH